MRRGFSPCSKATPHLSCLLEIVIPLAPVTTSRTTTTTTTTTTTIAVAAALASTDTLTKAQEDYQKTALQT